MTTVNNQTQEKVLLCSTLAVTAILVFLVGFSGVPVNHDAAIHLQCAELVLQGGIPYIDYVETNPPLAHYLHTVPVLLARLAGTPVPGTFQWIVLAQVLLSVFTYIRIRRLRVGADPAGVYLFAMGLLLFSVYVLRSAGFGQREHLFMVGFFPWLECRRARHEGRNVPLLLTLGIALLFAPFALLKPHFVFVACACEAVLLSVSRRWRTVLTPEVGVCIACSVGYLALFAVLPQSSREAYFHRLVPAMLTGYSVYNIPLWDMFWAIRAWRILFLLGVPVVFVALWMAWRAERTRLDLLGWVTACLSGAAIFFAQHKGFAYHFFPFFGAFLLLVLSVGCEGLGLFSPAAGDSTGPARGRAKVGAVFGLAVVMLCCAILWSRNACRDRERLFPSMYSGLLETIRAQTVPGDRVLCLTTGVIWIYPMLVYADRLPGSRYLQAFPVAFSYKGVTAGSGRRFPYRTEDQAPSDERQYLRELTADMERYRPALVLIQATESSDGCAPGFCMRDYLDQNGWTSSRLAAYAKLGCVAGFDVYRRLAGPSVPKDWADRRTMP